MVGTQEDGTQLCSLHGTPVRWLRVNCSFVKASASTLAEWAGSEAKGSGRVQSEEAWPQSFPWVCNDIPLSVHFGDRNGFEFWKGDWLHMEDGCKTIAWGQCWLSIYAECLFTSTAEDSCGLRSPQCL